MFAYHGRTHVDPNDALSADLLFQRRFAVGSTVGDPQKMALFAGESSAPVSTRTWAAEVSMLREAEDAQRRVGEHGTVIMQGTAGTHQT